MLSGVMADAWIVATIVAVVAGVVGVFIVLRGASFVAHAVPNSAFAGAAGAAFVGLDPMAGLAAFALLGALGIAWLGRRGRQDVATALVIVFMLGLGSLFLAWSSEYGPAAAALLFGEVLGVSPNQVGLTAVLGGAALIGIALMFRPLLLASVAPEMAAAHGVGVRRAELAFLVVVALSATVAVPVVGALLMFSLSVGPPAAAQCLARRPAAVVALSVAVAVGTVWASVAASYRTNWPIGFFVGVLGGGVYVAARAVAAIGARRAAASGPRAAPHAPALAHQGTP